MRLSSLQEDPRKLQKYVESIESDSEAITKDVIALAVYSNQPYSEIYNMDPRERKALAEVLKERAEAEERAIKGNR
jgi:hypothetical protein